MMDISKFKRILADNVLAPMLWYLDEWKDDAHFTRADVARCESILSDYLDSLAALTNPADQEIMDRVQAVVLALNALNEDTDYAILETEERENICELIQSSAVECGLHDPADDITEQWRDW